MVSTSNHIYASIQVTFGRRRYKWQQGPKNSAQGVLFLESCLAGAAPPKGWLPHSPSAELGDAASANVVVPAKTPQDR